MRNEKFAKRLGATRNAYQTATAREPLFLTEKICNFQKNFKKPDFFRKKCVYIGEGAKTPRKRNA
jgi:hypothetical protein